MPNYLAYGVTLESNLSISALLPISAEGKQSDIHLVLGQLPIWLVSSLYPGTQPSYTSNYGDDMGQPALRVWSVGQDTCLYFLYTDGTEFVLTRYGSNIWARWSEDLTLEDTLTYLLGPILGFVLRLRGTVCLHASAVVINDRVVVFVGDAGAGKSTISAAFAQRGYPVLSDDVVALVDRGDNFLVQPAYPRIRLWDLSVQALYGAPDALPRLVPTHPTWDKRYLDLNQTGYKFQSEPLPLAAIYYLNTRSDGSSYPQIEPMSIKDSLITLVANTYTNYLLDRQQRAHEFELLSRLVKHVPVRQITPHADIARLPQLLETVVADFQELSSSHI